MLNDLNFAIVCDLFRFSAFYCTNEGKIQKMNNFKEV